MATFWQNLRELLGGVSKRAAERYLQGTSAPAIVQAKLQPGCVRLIDKDPLRRDGTFSLMQLHERTSAKGKAPAFVFTRQWWDYVLEVNKGNEIFVRHVLNEGNTAYLYSRNGQGLVYMPAVGAMGGGQLATVANLPGFFEVRGIDLNDPPAPESAPLLPHLFHLFVGYRNGRLNYPAGVAYIPIIQFAEHIYIEKRLVK